MIKLMIVDSDPLIGRTYSKVLSDSFPNINNIGQAYDSIRGMDIAVREKPDIVIWGMDAPIMDRLTVIEHLKQQLPDVKVIVVSIYDDFQYVQEAIRCGAHDYLLKPLSISEFNNVVRQLSDEICPQKTEKDPVPADGSKTYQNVEPLVKALFEGRADDVRRFVSDWKNNLPIENLNSPDLLSVSLIGFSSDLLRAINHTNQCKVFNLLFNVYLSRTLAAASINEQINCFDDYIEKIISTVAETSGNSANTLVSKIQEIVELRLHEQLTLEQISSELYFSSAYISRLFKHSTGKNFSEYLMERRLDEAKVLLVSTDLSVDAISGRVGYDNSNSFRRAFKKRVGIPASVYRAENRAEQRKQ